MALPCSLSPPNVSIDPPVLRIEDHLKDCLNYPERTIGTFSPFFSDTASLPRAIGVWKICHKGWFALVRETATATGFVPIILLIERAGATDDWHLSDKYLPYRAQEPSLHITLQCRNVLIACGHPSCPGFLCFFIAISMDRFAATIPMALSPSTTAVLGDSWTILITG
jgi:hypothetical protein